MAIQTKFLPRLGNDPQSGPIVFTTNGSQNSNVLFTIDYPLGLLNSFLLQNAGRLNLNGTYNYVDINEEKPYYTNGEDGYYYVIWISNRWDIYDFSLGSDAIYFSNENTNYPWQVTSWTASNSIYNPAPNITIL
jgi:hypothetical protein